MQPLPIWATMCSSVHGAGGHPVCDGDNRNESLDSRSSYVGCIDERDILGKGTAVLYALYRFWGGKMNEMDTRFANQYNIQWFPGHMTKTLRMMEQEIQHVDASLVLLDARIPLSSLNPEIERITDRKPKLYALNKADLADPAVTEEWIRYFHAADAGCVAISAKAEGGANAVKVAIEKGFPVCWSAARTAAWAVPKRR